MSWLADIAGKAEDFLNKIDQNAAVALHTIEERTHSRKNSRTLKLGEDFTIASTPVNYTQDESDSILKPKIVSTVSSDVNNLNGNHSNTDGSLAAVNRISNGSDKHTQEIGSKLVLSNGNSSKTTSKTENHDQNRSGSRKNRDGDSRNGSVVENGSSASLGKSKSNGVTNAKSPKKSDEELLDFLNSKDQREIDEVSLLKNEIATQAREMGLLLKNHRKLQTDFERQKTEVAELKSLLAANSQDTSGAEDNARKELENLLESSQRKDEEIQSLQERLDQAVSKLKDVEELHRFENRVQQLELENRKMLSHQKEHETKIQNYELSAQHSVSQIQSLREGLSKLEKEHAEYKEKAKSILRSKDELIASMKDGRNTFTAGSESSVASTESEILAEIGSLRNERELLHGEISQSRVMYETCKEENRKLELELQKMRGAINDLQEVCAKERSAIHKVEEENLQISQNFSTVKLSLERERSERRKLDEQIQKLNSEKTGRLSVMNDDQRSASMLNGSPARYSPSYDAHDNAENLKTRVKALTQSLLEKQSLINNISADKQLLQIRVERLEQQIRDISSETAAGSGFTQAVISNQPLYLSESPWDSSMALKVKRAYSRMDSLCCQLGLAMRHRPNLRLGFAAYIACLHLWVFFILFYWSHSTPLPPIS